MLKFVLGAVVGYALGSVLGAQAGHDRFEQLKRTYQRVSDHPGVQGAAGIARARLDETVHAATNGHSGARTNLR